MANALDSTTREELGELIRQHLAMVVHLLSLTASDQVDAQDTVHRLRIATRRADALLQLAVQHIDPETSARLTDCIKQIRKRAGRVREQDVLQNQMQSAKSALLVELRRRDSRSKVSKGLEKIARKLLIVQPLAGLVEKLIERSDLTGSKGEQRISGWYREPMQRMAVELIHRFPQNPSDASDWHQLRIGCKNFRYALEIAKESCGFEGPTDLVPSLKSLQQSLGELNDLATHCQKAGKWLTAARSKKDRERWHRFLHHQQRLYMQQLQRVREWWNDEGEKRLRKNLLSFTKK